VAYLDGRNFQIFVTEDSARLIAAVKKIGKGGVEDKAAPRHLFPSPTRGRGTRTPDLHIFRTARTFPASFVLKPEALASNHTPTRAERGIDMRVYNVVLSLAMSIACGIAIQSPAFSEEYRWEPWNNSFACTPVTFSALRRQIPDRRGSLRVSGKMPLQLSGHAVRYLNQVFARPTVKCSRAPKSSRRDDLLSGTYDDQ